MFTLTVYQGVLSTKKFHFIFYKTFYVNRITKKMILSLSCISLIKVYSMKKCVFILPFTTYIYIRTTSNAGIRIIFLIMRHIDRLYHVNIFRIFCCITPIIFKFWYCKPEDFNRYSVFDIPMKTHYARLITGPFLYSFQTDLTADLT